MFWRVSNGAPEAPGVTSVYFSRLTSIYGVLWRQTFSSLATRGTQMEEFLITKNRGAARKVEEEGSQSPTSHIPAAPTSETMSVTPKDIAPSTSVDGGKHNQDETARGRSSWSTDHTYPQKMRLIPRETDQTAGRSGTNNSFPGDPEEEEGGEGYPALGTPGRQKTAEGGLCIP